MVAVGCPIILLTLLWILAISSAGALYDLVSLLIGRRRAPAQEGHAGF
jgi:hypothetical protein